MNQKKRSLGFLLSLIAGLLVTGLMANWRSNTTPGSEVAAKYKYIEDPAPISAIPVDQETGL